MKTALFADDLCIWSKKKTKKQLTKTLQIAINQITKFCEDWNFTINKQKTCYIVFTTAGQRVEYSTKYELKLTIDNTQIPLDPKPTFLGITLDPKINFKNHLEKIKNKINSKINLIKRIRGFKWVTSTKTAITLYKSFIRAIFD